MNTETTASPKRLRCLLVGAQVLPSIRHTLAVALLKACLDADPALAGRIDVELLELIAPDAAQVADAVARRAPDIVGFSCYVWNMAAFKAAWPEIRRALPQALLILGGPEAYPRADRLLAAHREVDAVVVGEGDCSFPRWVKAVLDAEPWDSIPGLAFRRGERVVAASEAPPIKDLDSLPSPYLSGTAPIAEDVEMLVLETARGCPFDCAFCDWPGRGRKPRNFSLARVLAEIAHMIARAPKLRLIHVTDADLFIEKARAREFLAAAAKLLENTSVSLSMEAYLGRFDDETIALLECGRFRVAGGVQTATPGALAVVNRFFHREKIEATLKKFRALKPPPRVTLQLILGLPGDMPEGFRDTLNWTLSLMPLSLEVYEALVLPGSDMGLHPERYDMAYESEPPHRILSTSTFSPPQLAAARTSALIAQALLSLRPVATILTHLAPVAFVGPHPFLSAYEGFAECLSREGLMKTTSLEGWDIVGEADRARSTILCDLNLYEAVIDRLRDFAAAALDARGRGELVASFERYLEVQRHALRWTRAAKARAPEVVEALEWASVTGGRLLWLGLEDLADETPLAEGFAGQRDQFHLYVGALARQRFCSHQARHAACVADLESSDAPSSPADAAVVSHLFSRLRRDDRGRLVSFLSRSVRPGGRLIVWDNLLGASPLEDVSRSDWQTPPPESASEAAQSFTEHGWKLDDASFSPEPFHRLRFIRR